MTAAPEPTDRDAAEQQLRAELMTVQIDDGLVDIERMKQDTERMRQDTERLRFDVAKAIKLLEQKPDDKLLKIEIYKLTVATMAAAG